MCLLLNFQVFLKRFIFAQKKNRSGGINTWKRASHCVLFNNNSGSFYSYQSTRMNTLRSTLKQIVGSELKFFMEMSSMIYEKV